MCRRYRDATPDTQRYALTHTRTHTITHIAPRPKEQQCVLKCKTVGVREPTEKGARAAAACTRNRDGFQQACVVIVVSGLRAGDVRRDWARRRTNKAENRPRSKYQFRERSERLSPPVSCASSATEKRTAVPARRGVKAKQHRQELDIGRYLGRRRRRNGVSGSRASLSRTPSQPRPPLLLLLRALSPSGERERV